MEENRLRPMPAKYDPALFNKIYEDTRNLTRSLAYGIDHRRFGVTQEDICSWFDVKFLYTFTKYYGTVTEGVLKGNIINALQNFKCRILKKAYTVQYSQSIISTEDTPVSDIPEETNYREHYYNQMMDFMKAHLSDNAYCLLEIQLNPPPYILKRINPGEHSNLQKIPDQLLLEYFDLGLSDKAFKYLAHLKREIKQVVEYAKDHFKASSYK